MAHWNRTLRIAGVALPLMVCALAWAADNESPSLYQSSPGTGSGSSDSGIIAYRPIPTSSLTAAATVQPVGGARSRQRGVGLAAPQAGLTGQPGQGSEQMPGQQNAGKLPPSYQTGILGDGPYTLGRDDVIRIEVRGQPEFSGDYVIGFDGRIQYNYIGDVPIAGLTKYEVQQVLEKLLEKYIRVPAITVTIAEYNSKVVYVIGEVNRPGKFVMRGDAIKLREAILAAGLPTHDAALGRVHVIKPDLNDPNIRVINMKRILYKGQLKDDVDLFPGEIVVIPSTVLSKVNDFLGSLISPVTRAASVAALAAL